ncbi:YdcH family protein [Algicella marina]|uniref:DUF465 domain-containing protein n=1 Tax=Algicella marina TaxID=2683284 RepID=A0A6P1T5J6_9RHOB|nr:DUF465 domain-containing protein [Algicella marina]QHQ37025.1 DUF465 domain-containing protein [Algicella marina]
MTMSSHLTELQKKHQTLSLKIEEELRSPAADDLAVATLKRQKLYLKDEIARLSSQL